MHQTRGGSLTDVLLSICNPLTRDAEWYTRRIHYGRRNSRYRPAHELALLVLKGLALSDLHSANSQGVTAFMLDMNAIFERFVTRLVADALADSPLTVSAQQSIGAVVVDESTGHTYSTIRPDLIIVDYRTGQRVPIDVKYKLYEDKKFGSGDIYQLFTYAYALGGAASKRNAGVLYAATTKVSGPALQIKPMAEVSGAHIRGAGLDVSAILDELNSEASPSVLSSVREMIEAITGTKQ